MEPRPTLLCVHPHPDDESIACGGVLARAAAAGARTVVVTCTGGEEGENLAGIDLGDEDLTTHRRRELAEALRVLGVDEHVPLGYRDSGMAGSSANDHPGSFHRADVEEAARRLAAVVRRVRPDVVVSDDRLGTYGHPDHVQAHRVTIRAVELAADPDAEVAGAPWSVPKRYVHSMTRSRVRAAHDTLVAAGLPSPFGPDGPDDEVAFGTPDDLVTTVVDVTPWLATKRAALTAHRSQIGSDSFFLNTPEELAADLFGTEEFVLEVGTPGVDDGIEDDLFAGLAAVGGDHLDEVVATSAGGSGRPDDLAAPDGDLTDERDRAVDDGRGEAGGHGVDAARFRDVLGRFVTGVTAMTTRVDDRPHAMTASSVASVSLDPPLVLVCVDRGAAMADEVRDAGRFALSFLAADQAELSTTFADADRPPGAAQFREVATARDRAEGPPVIAGAAGWVDCRVWAIHDGGDHLIVVGEVLDLGHDDTVDPLVYHRGRYVHLGASHDVR